MNNNDNKDVKIQKNDENIIKYQINDNNEIFAQKKIEIYTFGSYTFTSKEDYLNFMKTINFKS